MYVCAYHHTAFHYCVLLSMCKITWISAVWLFVSTVNHLNACCVCLYVQEAVQCVMEMDQPSLLFVFVRMGLECTLERSQKAREHMGMLYYQLIQKGIIPIPKSTKGEHTHIKSNVFISTCNTMVVKRCGLSLSLGSVGFLEMLEQADDMAIDVPFIWLYLAELLSPLLREGGSKYERAVQVRIPLVMTNTEKESSYEFCLMLLCNLGLKGHSTPKNLLHVVLD